VTAHGRRDTPAPSGPGPSVRLTVVDAALREAVLELAPARDQEPFSGAARDSLPEAERDPQRLPVAILADGRPVGFFVLDQAGHESIADSTAVLLRAFFVDARWQRQGFAAAALKLLPGFVHSRMPHVSTVVLTVNTRNVAALKAYLRGGFRDTRELDHSGSLGPQHVLHLSL
jgi:RimJ/RimL family protein N-acetyltransferase